MRERRIQPEKLAAPAKGPAGPWANQLVDALPDFVALCRDGRIEALNQAGATLLGLDGPDAAAGHLLTDYIAGDYKVLVEDGLGPLVEAGELVPLKLVGADGRAIDVDLLAVAAGGDADDGVIIFARDITERLRSAQAILRSETRYRHLLDQALDMIAVFVDGRFTYINSAGVALLGAKDADALIGRSLSEVVHADYREIIDFGLDAFVGEGVLPLKLVAAGGGIIDVEVAVMAFGEEGQNAFMMEARDISERKRSAERLREREARLAGIMDTVADGIISIDSRGKILSFNKAAERIFGYASAEAVGQNITIVMPENERHGHDDHIERYQRRPGVRPKVGTTRELTGLHKDGKQFPLELALSELRIGRDVIFTGIVRDITERKKAEEALRRAHDELEIRVRERTRELTEEIGERRRAEERLRLAGTVIENTSEGVIVADADFRVTQVNPAFTSITGYGPGEVIGRQPTFHAVASEDHQLWSNMWRALDSRGHWEGELWNRRKSGEDYAERLSISAIRDDLGTVVSYAIVISDITKRKQDEERILYQANYDALTGLPNRALFHDRLEKALATTGRSKQSLGLMFIDLDGFKLVNDTLGHDVGDLLLKEASARLLECVRDTDTVARLGGDEFTVILPTMTGPQDATIVAQRVLDKLCQPFHLKKHEAFVSGSIGITIFPDDAMDAGDLLKNADAAMYRAKEQGKANYQFFTADMNAAVTERLMLKNALSKALDRNEFTLHYQPKLDLDTGTICGAEALLRWNNPELGNVPPIRFIPVLEESGLIVEIGAWILRTACRQYRDWLEMGLPKVPIAVNLSPRQLKTPGFLRELIDVLDETKIERSGLELEITESMLMSDQGGGFEALKQISEMGIQIAMDDFGTGYSSLSYLKRFPIDIIKIDRAFVADITTDADDAAIIRTIIDMGHNLRRKVIAEGVESRDQLELLRQYGCHEIQGYYFCRPLPEAEVTDFIRQHATPMVAPDTAASPTLEPSGSDR